MTVTRGILQDIYSERERQDRKWGPQSHSIPEWVTILAEEFGEASKCANELYFRHHQENKEYLRDELIQVAAVAVAMVEQLDKGKAWVE